MFLAAGRLKSSRRLKGARFRSSKAKTGSKKMFLCFEKTSFTDARTEIRRPPPSSLPAARPAPSSPRVRAQCSARTGSGGVTSPAPARTMAATAESVALHRAVRLLDAETPPSDVDVEECRVAFKAARGILANALAYPPRRAEDRAAVRTTTVELRGGKSIRLDGTDIENALTLRCASIPSIPSISSARRRRRRANSLGALFLKTSAVPSPPPSRSRRATRQSARPRPSLPRARSLPPRQPSRRRD